MTTDLIAALCCLCFIAGLWLSAWGHQKQIKQLQHCLKLGARYIDQLHSRLESIEYNQRSEMP